MHAKLQHSAGLPHAVPAGRQLSPLKVVVVKQGRVLKIVGRSSGLIGPPNCRHIVTAIVGSIAYFGRKAWAPG